MKVNKNIWTGKNKPYNRNSLYFPNGVNQDGGSAGGGESGGSSYIYYDQKRTILNIKDLWEHSSTVKINFGGQLLILPTYDVLVAIEEDPSFKSSIIAVCIDPNIKFQEDPTKPPLTLIERDPDAFEYVNEVSITEEEYFNLNA